jgi:hypothetical protein
MKEGQTSSGSVSGSTCSGEPDLASIMTSSNPAQRQRERYATDPEYRERERQRQRERYATDPEYRKRKRQQLLERYATDPEYRERQRQGHLERQRERYANDPEHRARLLERKRARARRTRGDEAL